MKVNIYYGGRGLIDDPTLYVLSKISDVLQEVRASVTRYNLYEQKTGIAMLPSTLKDADAVVLAVSVEWFGIGGLMQQFLDACWMYADRSRLKKLYMFPVVIATAGGERDAENHLIKSWELLGGMIKPGICAYVDNPTDFETDTTYCGLIEKKAEEIYRTVHQKMAVFPSSAGLNAGPGSAATGIELTPDESDRLSVYVSNDTYVRKQKEDVEQLSQMYKDKLDRGREESKQEFIRNFKDAFVAPDPSLKAAYAIQMTDTSRTLVIEVAEGKLKCYYGELQNPDVTAKTTRDIINKLVNGRVTFQGAFMLGQLTYKGDFKILRTFDQLFRFS